MSYFVLRPALQRDAQNLLEVYRPFVESKDYTVSDASFEYKAPDIYEWRRRMENIRYTYPYILAERDDYKVCGYAYAHTYNERAAYRGNAELTIYLSPEGQGHGLGRAMYTALEKILACMGVVNAYACITASNERSVRLHKALGYEICGSFPHSGFKNGRWLDMIWMSKQIAPYPKKLAPLKIVHALPKGCVDEILREANVSLKNRSN